MIDWRNKTILATAAAILVAGFSVGFLTARATDGHSGTARSVGGELVEGPATGLFGKPRDRNAPRASDVRPTGFAVWKQRLDTTGASPAACIQFSRPLDTSKPYGDYVVVSPALATPPAVVAKGDELCVSGFGFTDRRITLLKGLPGRGSEALEANADLDFAFGEQPPYVGFVGNGVVLPREDGDGVAIETVNVTGLAIEVWHVSDRNLVRKEISAPDPVAEGDWDYEWGDDSPNDIGVKVWTGNLAVTGAAGERVTTVFPLGAVLKALKPGAYVVKVRDSQGGRSDSEESQPAQARRWVIYTDMAMTTYRGSTGVDAIVRSLKTARPMAGVRINLIARNGDSLGEAKTDINGRVTFPETLLKGTDALEPRMLMAYGPGSDYTATDLQRSPMDLTSHGVGGRADEAITGGRETSGLIDGFVYTDRGIYRPGEMLHLVALVRNGDGQAIKDRKGALVIYRPSGVEAFRFRFEKTPQGYAAAHIALPRTAPRGQWQARLVIDGIDEPQGRATFAVEDFAPQRLGVDVNANKDAPIVSATETRPVRVSARYLYGATASGLEVTGEARIKADPNPFPAFRDYSFGDDNTPFEEKYIDLPQTVTDGQGAAVFPLDASVAGETSQPLTVMLTASVYEPGGRPVRESETLKIRQAPMYFGVKTDSGDASFGRAPKVSFNVIAVNPKGEKIAAKGVTVRLIAEHWDYDSYVQDGRWQWRRTHRDVIVATKTYDINANTGLNFDRNLDWGDYRIEVELPGQNARTVSRFSAGWGAPSSGEDAPDKVRVTVGGRAHAQGDTIEVTLKPPYRGEAQIAVATDHLIEVRNVTVGEGGTTVRLKSSAAWGGGAYILVSVIQPRDPVKSARPRRAVGLVYVPLDPKSRKLEVSVPVSQTPVKPYRGADGRTYIDVPVQIKGTRIGDRARVSVAAVDQGILNLTKFRAPNPVGWYFGKRALGVDYSDDYGRLLDPNLGAPAGLNFGGDQIGGEGLSTTPIRTVALWSGVVETGLDGKSMLKLPIDKFNGELKIMAVAWTDDAVGSAEERLIVREPVVMDLALPRFLSPGDKAFATLELTNVDGPAGVYQAVVEGIQGLAVTLRKAFTLGKGERAIEAVPLNAPSAVGVSRVNLSLSGQGVTFNDSFGIQTRSGWGPVTRTSVEQQAAGSSFTLPATLISDMQAGSVAVEVSYSPFRGIDPAPLAASLTRYPYGCTEQVVSSASPWVYASQSLVGANAARPSGPALKMAVGRLLDRQAEDGSFGLWSVGDGAADGFIGAYATDFLLEARAMGVQVPQEAIDKALSAMREIAVPDGYYSVNYRMSYPNRWTWFGIGGEERSRQLQSRAQAYALYVLAKGGTGDLARLRWYHDVQMKKESSPLAIAQVGTGLAMMGDRARARSALKTAISKLGYSDQADWYQSALRDLAGVIALAYETGEGDIAKSLTARLEQAVKSPDSMNTIEKAYVLRAASFMLKASGPVSIEASGVNALPSGLNSARYNVPAPAKARFKNGGGGPLWRTVTVIGTPVSEPGASAQGLNLSKSFYTLDGSRIDPSNLTQGQKIIVMISGRSDRAESRPIVIDDPLAAGLEIESTLSNADSQTGPFRFLGKLSETQAQEARDDRFVAALDVSSTEGFSVAYMARVVTPGSFYLPGAEARDFYRTDIFARTGGSRIAVAPR